MEDQESNGSGSSPPQSGEARNEGSGNGNNSGLAADAPAFTSRRNSNTTQETRGRRRRKPAPGVEWQEKWTNELFESGRVLLIDYVAKEHTVENRRKIVASEFNDIDGLRNFYLDENLSRQAALRCIHVQNAPWATRFLLRKFNIDANDDLIGTTFGRWAKYEKPKRRGQGKAAKPVPSGKTFRAQRDPWRGISRAAFGLDYLRQFERHAVEEKPANQGMKMMELNHYDSLDNPTYGYDAYAQRLSVYVQLSDGEPGTPEDPEIHNPYNVEEAQEYQRLKKQYDPGDHKNGNERYIPKLETLDNGSTIIIFSHSATGSMTDTLIGARGEIEQRWRRLTFYLPREDTSNDERLAIECMDFILRDVFKALAVTWEKYINICETHTSILEDKIYENPADESRAPELWTNSSLWLKVERLLSMHTELVKEMRNHLRDVAHENPNTDDPWLSASAEELEKLALQFRNGVVNPTNNLSELMYKSVGIRDARVSNQLGLSMWRLSWITFIFLPLTFVCGFFGMNVDTFESNPSIKWFFISSVPLFTVVLAIWYGVKHSLTSARQSPLRRGIYEQLFFELAESHPQLWSRRGPRDHVVPVGKLDSWKWKMVTRWFDPEHTIRKPSQEAGLDELGTVSRVKRRLARRWLDDLVVLPEDVARKQMERDALAAEMGEEARKGEELGAVGELLGLGVPIAVAGVEPTAASRMAKRVGVGRFKSLSPLFGRREADGRSGRSGSRSGESTGRVEGPGGKAQGETAAVMVEEKSEDEVGEEEM